ncbi:MAG: hypothetical protein FK731_08865 [Asgard group archaeon]|nr:hypothetical protein [Asgard group archaeon]
MSVYGYDVDEIDSPRYVTRGEWELTGTKALEAYMPLKHGGALTSGTFGLSGIYAVSNWCLPYDDISGISGCIGVNLRKMVTQTNTGQLSEPFTRRKTAIMHMGVVKMKYQSGTLDGTVVTLKWGDEIAPTISGFRARELILPTINGLTGIQQVPLGWYVDYPSNATGSWKKVYINPHWLREQVP